MTDPTKKFRPAPGGVSIAHYSVTAGTLGAVVRDNVTEELLILSNNHVLAASNKGEIGDPVLQPGPADGGSGADRIGELVRFVPIILGSGLICSAAKVFVAVVNKALSLFSKETRLEVIGCQQERNVVDCAVARPDSESDLSLEILEIGKPLPELVVPVIGMEVQKFGRTTQYTKDEILVLDATVNVGYGPGKVAVFEHQIVAGPMSAGGDSGSLVLDMDRRPVGLLFAGSDKVTIFNEIGRVVGALGIRFSE